MASAEALYKQNRKDYVSAVQWHRKVEQESDTEWFHVNYTGGIEGR